MGWLAVSPAEEGHGGPHRSGTLSPLAGALPAILPRGTLQLEARYRPGTGEARLLSLRHRQPWEGAVELHLRPGGRVALVLRQEKAQWSCEIVLPDAERAEVYRITYRWDAPARLGQLWVERPDRDRPAQCQRIEAPPPLPTLALIEEVAGLRSAALGGRTVFAAVSDRCEPVGPMPLLGPLTPVEMADGQLRTLSRLRLGDLVRTRSGVAPVLAVISHEVPARGRFRPVTLRRPYLGLQRDLVVAAGQRLESAGAAVEYLFGCESVLVEARHMLAGQAGVLAPAPDVLRYWQVLMPAREALITAGCGMESLAIGRMRMRKDLWGASLLAGLPRGRLPDHGGVARRVLDRYEAVTLAAQRVA